MGRSFCGLGGLTPVVVKPFSRLLSGRWPHMPRLPRRRPHCGSPLQLSHIPNGPGPGEYVDGTPPGRAIPGGSPAVFRSTRLADRLWLLPILTLIPAVGSLPFRPRVGPFHLPFPLTWCHFAQIRGPNVVYPLRYRTTKAVLQRRYECWKGITHTKCVPVQIFLRWWQEKAHSEVK